MSAIFGVWNRDGAPVDRGIIEEMSSRLAHRGSDGVGQIVEGSVAVGHRLLHTTPESLSETQPLRDRESSVLLCCDARIDNRSELLAQTELRGRDLNGVSDSELILAAYKRWGAECPRHLAGDFAFAIWDGREESLLLVRDHMGVRSLYYHIGPRTVAFATEIKALFAVPEVPRQLDELRVVQYLEAELEDSERTFFSQVSRVPAAHSVRIDRLGLRKERYWRLDASTETRFASDSQYSEALLELFTRSVQNRVRSAFPVGAALSGGLDSSGISCVARDLLARQGNAPLHTFSALFPGLPDEDRKLADESPFIDAVLATGGFESHRIPVDQLAPFHGLGRLLFHLDEAPLAYNLYMHWALFDEARSAGVRVFLDGFDGDACIGYGRELFGELARQDNWESFTAEIRAAVQVSGIATVTPAQLAHGFAMPVIEERARSGRLSQSVRGAIDLSRRFGYSRTATITRHVFRPALNRALERLGFSRDQRLKTLTLTNPALAARLGFSVRAATGTDREEQRYQSPSESHREGLEMPAFQLALDTGDKAAAAFSLEARYPFFDRDLMQYCVSMPVSQKLSKGWPRAVFRRAMQGILPEAVRWRIAKQDISPAFVRGMRAVGRIIAQTEPAPGARSIADLLDLTEVSRRHAQFSDPANLRSARSDAMALYRAHVFDLWLTQSGF